jgi:acetoin utilization deacetylase AcuC-like enzyme
VRPTIFYSDRYYADLGNHVFPMVKYRLIRDLLLADGVVRLQDFTEPSPATVEDALLVHTREYIDKLLHGTLTPFDVARLELPYSMELVDASFLGAGGTIAAVRSCVERGVGVNLAGGLHHAFADHGEGFCVLNDVAMGAATALADGLSDRVAVIDCDVHQGNGTAAIFADEERVFTLSIHQEANYPYEKPPGDLDVGLPDGADGTTYLAVLEDVVPRALDSVKPGLVLYVAGADPYEDDLLGGLSLSSDDLSERDRIIMDRCAERGIPFAVTLAGGYAANTADTVRIHAATVARALAVGERI